MRPPQFAGEDDTTTAVKSVTDITSMRPPQFAGEDPPQDTFTGSWTELQ